MCLSPLIEYILCLIAIKVYKNTKAFASRKVVLVISKLVDVIVVCSFLFWFAFLFFRGQTALHKAALYERRTICSLLVQAGASLTRTDYDVSPNDSNHHWLNQRAKESAWVLRIVYTVDLRSDFLGVILNLLCEVPTISRSSYCGSSSKVTEA